MGLHGAHTPVTGTQAHWAPSHHRCKVIQGHLCCESQVWWHMPIIPATRQEDWKFEVTSGNLARPCYKQTNKQTRARDGVPWVQSPTSYTHMQTERRTHTHTHRRMYTQIHKHPDTHQLISRILHRYPHCDTSHTQQFRDTQTNQAHAIKGTHTDTKHARTHTLLQTHTGTHTSSQMHTWNTHC